MNDIKSKMAAGAAWLVLFRLTERSIGIVSTLILARLLVPADFGLIAMAMSMLAALELLGAFSFDLALIQNQNAQRHHYDTAWTFGVFFSIFKALALCALAIPVANFYSEPRLELLMYSLAVVTLLEGFVNIGIVAFQKDLELHKEFQLGLIKKLAGFIVTVSLAIWLRSYWALMAGILATRVVGLVLSYRLHPFRPRLSMTGASELFNFSKWLLLNNFLIFLNNRGADLVIGRLAGARELGLYSVAYEISNLPTTELVWPISRAVFPGYARMANDLAQLRTAFVQVLGLVALITVPAGVAIALLAEQIVQVLLGSKWVEAAPLIQVLAIFGVVRSLHGPTGSIYLALGKPHFVAWLQFVQLVVAIGSMVALLPRLGLIGAGYALLAGASLAMVLNYGFALRDLKLPMLDLVRELWRPILGAMAMAAVVHTAGPHWPIENSVFGRAAQLALLGALALGSYIIAVGSFWFSAGKPEGAEALVLRIGMRRLRMSA